jgi:deazaflavin-dependent oxidoreductase (nitroreductase family)
MSDSARIRPPWWLKYVNKVMIGIQKIGLPLGEKGPVILVVPGRKSGKPRSTPITPMTVEGKRYVLGGLPGSDWAANLRAAGAAELKQGKTSQRVRVIELGPEEAKPLLRLFPVEVPTGVSFMKNAGLITGPNPDEYEALAGRCPVFRFDPVNA